MVSPKQCKSWQEALATTSRKVQANYYFTSQGRVRFSESAISSINSKAQKQAPRILKNDKAVSRSTEEVQVLVRQAERFLGFYSYVWCAVPSIADGCKFRALTITQVAPMALRRTRT